mmetsp:Transcript_6907/g.5146  ORF Transcript_6907/g.5146 Transcript_6907/m.5146 type:complete len:296 (+) Transcript_6907:206-1093(+)|eukprot:CAMPEP_0202978020 /NCGR_PEP_ID=MMETSP1396-20130829/84595_1 /ASSEMBLY_ACC=CAM_ASM_000872 /TAXON_ID= /ORGANISM="Pseudokeronopsis sp., Strain Brazil" /LENGTH=295 /DNA_ID=CAMNT_0049716877 /DNA_START=1634 /DNA_END=2521 /DNA_ORIENTATION=+
MAKICDMGNGCWTYHHFTPEIQTRQYRSPEVIVGQDYNTSADIWSFACTIFEMATGDFLFEPRKGSNYDKDDDHLAQMMELLGRMPENLALSGKHSKKFFTPEGHLKRINGLHYWPLTKVLIEKYHFKDEEAQAFEDFLLPMLAWHPEKRATAQQMLNHPWLNMEPNYEYKLSDKEFEIMMMKKKLKDELQPPPKSRKEASLEELVEMNELLLSEPDLNHADLDVSGACFDSSFGSGASCGSRSLMDDEEQGERVRRRRDRDAKVNNSFTGPYPIDPTDFNHTDKGANYQFEHIK